MTWERHPVPAPPQIAPLPFNVVVVCYAQGDTRERVYQATERDADGKPVWNEIDTVPPGMTAIDISNLFE